MGLYLCYELALDQETSESAVIAGGDSRQVRGEIFEHPDFERLEMPE